MNQKKSGIYAIIHAATGIAYVGQAKDVGRRWYRHRYELKAGVHSSTRLQRAWSKYGPDAFAFEMLEEVEAERAALCAAEQRWIDLYSAMAGVFNLAPVAGSLLGMKNTPVAVANKTAAQRREDVNARRSASLKKAWGTEDMREAQRDRAKAFWASEAAKIAAEKSANSKRAPSAREQASQKQSAVMACGAARAARSKAVAAWCATPGVAEQKSAASKRAWSDPTRRARVAATWARKRAEALA